MNLFFKDTQTALRMREGPLGQYIDSFAAEMRAEGYAHGSAILQIRLIADFSLWLLEQRIEAREIAAEQRSRGFPGRSAADLLAEDDARLAEDAERDQELDAARRGDSSGGV